MLARIPAILLAIPAILPRTAPVSETPVNAPCRRIPWMQVAWALGFVLLAGWFLIPRVNAEAIVDVLRSFGPWGFYLAFALLTLIGLPSTPFFVIGGAAFPLWQNMAGVTLGMAVHFVLAYLISSRWLRNTISRLLEKRGMRPPTVTAGNEWKVALMIKFAPGAPMFLKSYLMGVAGISPGVYMAVSFPATWIYALALLTLGKSAMEGSLGLFFGGVALLIFVAASWRFVKARMRRM